MSPRRAPLPPTILLLIAALGGARAVAAQGREAVADSAHADQPAFWWRQPTAYGAWVAAAHRSGFATRTGVRGHRDFYQAGLRLLWPIGDGENPGRIVRASYFVDLVPLAISTDMPDYVWTNRCRPDTSCPDAHGTPHTAYGVGLAPFGWSLSAGTERVRLTVEASGGGLWFSRPIPDPAATRFNFTATVGPLLEWRTGPGQSLRLGYLWHHTSNGGRGLVNPGLNSGILSLGASWGRHSPRTSRPPG